MLPQREPHLMRHALRDILRRRFLGRMPDLHREHPPGALDQRSVERRAQRRRVDRGRHQQDTQVRAQHLLRLPGQRQGHVALQAPLVEFIKNHDAHALKARVVDQHPRQDAFGEHLDPRRCAHAALETDPVPHRPADRLPQQRGHPLRDLPRRQPPRFQNQDFGTLLHVPVENGKRQHGGLAGTRRRRHHQARHLRQPPVHGVGNLQHRQFGEFSHRPQR